MFQIFWNANRWLLIYLAGINVLTFILFGVDKWKAVHRKWRIREAALLGCALLGGTIGGLLAMYRFRHKTKKLYFTLSLPVMLLAQIVLVIYLTRSRMG